MSLAQYKHIKTPDYAKTAEDFFHELQAAAKGERGNLLFIKTYLPQQPIISEGTIQTVVMGGTNYDFAVVEIKDGAHTIIHREKGKLPRINSIDALTGLFALHLRTKVDGIAVNLGFPLKYFKGEKGQPDGIFLKATKEHSFRSLLGHKVGEIVLDRYIRNINSYTLVAVANDIVCLAEKDAAMTLGTGYNLGMAGEDEEGKYVINFEAGSSNAFEATDELEEIDKNSVNQNSNRFEKMISGYYLPLHFNYIASKSDIRKRIYQAEQLSELAAEDKSKAGELARELFDRSARYAAAHIAGLYKFKGEPEKLDINVEGCLYHYGYKYQRSVQQGLIDLGIKEKTVTFHTRHDSSLYGALKLLC